MNRALKSLLLWLLIAALPIQGLAAAMKATCGPTHHMPGMSMSGMIMSAGMGTHMNASAQLHDHQHAHEASSHHDGPAPQASSMPDDEASSDPLGKQVKSSTCGACATCCVGAVAPPTASFHVPEPDFSNHSIISPASRLAGYIPPSLERPPKFSLV